MPIFYFDMLRDIRVCVKAMHKIYLCAINLVFSSKPCIIASDWLSLQPSHPKYMFFVFFPVQSPISFFIIIKIDVFILHYLLINFAPHDLSERFFMLLFSVKSNFAIKNVFIARILFLFCCLFGKTALFSLSLNNRV